MQFRDGGNREGAPALLTALIVGYGASHGTARDVLSTLLLRFFFRLENPVGEASSPDLSHHGIYGSVHGSSIASVQRLASGQDAKVSCLCEAFICY